MPLFNLSSAKKSLAGLSKESFFGATYPHYLVYI